MAENEPYLSILRCLGCCGQRLRVDYRVAPPEKPVDVQLSAARAEMDRLVEQHECREEVLIG